MPRRSSPGRSTGRSSSTLGSTTQSRGAHTMAAPAHHAPAAPAAAAPSVAAQPRQPGLFAQMAATAGGVAVGSAVGHTMANAVGGLFSGGSSSEAAPAQQAAAPMQNTAYDQQQQYQFARTCDADAKAFTRCLESTNNDMSSCQYYLDMLKQCQSFSNSQSF
ncbi:hypothetical protein GGI07_000923 [Coemansia sp. Benny D115]|nr:hypothetical protein GGI07_000923 [Coemansia sp. Benny D115]